ncbi:minor teichoic acid biosynthesis protein GgaB [Paenibacillus sp. J45TS6]|uniref:bifunctional glycosyltransferase/CDP-glycerol:glycerophosphate glycerophosphotransferase n=1 Tax=Paenibacillus sp. J45TS6 TaxID=2807196 RepID=UPI001B2BBB98|nr:CDP-glycerol glycerophosphotransferase family protein [Paenibacillus sp. J45TS6]GIP42108.1 minor teichoic acid biosynthesis protein GgaB [Paenibacillus sp. J45TS6]
MERDSVEYRYLFSIVMAVYKVEEYLEEAIDSVISQTLDFEKHIQLILVNDGSPDNSESICLNYQQEYPNNIVYIHKENGGVSSARNEGLKYVQGKYVNFLDSDDKFSKETLKNVFNFFEKNNKEVDVVSIPLIFFDAKSGNHILNYKYNSSKVVDVFSEYRFIQLQIGSSFIKSTYFQKIRFNENMKYAEDAEVLHKIILEKGTLGVLKEGVYFYRRRPDNSSAIQMSEHKKEWYNEYLKNFSLGVVDYSKRKLGFVSKYTQYLVMYDLQWRLKLESRPSVLEEQELYEFYELLSATLSNIEDSIILEMPNMNLYLKNDVLLKKYKEKPRKVYLKDDIRLYINNNYINSLKNQKVTLDFISMDNNILSIEGHFGSLFDKDEVKIEIKINNSFYELTNVDREEKNLYSLGKVIKTFKGFIRTFDLRDLEETNLINFYVSSDQNHRVPIGLHMGKFSNISNFRNSYYSAGDWILLYKNNGLQLKKKSSQFDKLKTELSYLYSIYSSKEIGSKKAIIARNIHFLFKALYKKEIWLFMDRQHKADDNAEHLFKYSQTQKDRIKKIFVINENSSDYSRMKKIGKVIPFGSYRHKIMVLITKNIISSHAEDWVFNPFNSMSKYYRNLMNSNFIFLQHGIMHNDLSSWLNKYNKNIKLFTTTTEREYEAILNGKYTYDRNVVKLLGLTRYDNLYNYANDSNKSKKQILISPTWRNHLVTHLNQSNGERKYSKTFKHSEYFSMYNNLINDARLNEMANKLGYSIIFLPHPNIRQQIEDFDINDNIQISFGDDGYQKLLVESSLLVTDFSSLAFDFAYLRKPVIYFQFDENHIAPDYFSYEQDGFGPVFNTYEETVNSIIEHMKNNCNLDMTYLDRINQFYTFNDNQNCKRVYEEIKKL